MLASSQPAMGGAAAAPERALAEADDDAETRQPPEDSPRQDHNLPRRPYADRQLARMHSPTGSRLLFPQDALSLALRLARRWRERRAGLLQRRRAASNDGLLPRAVPGRTRGRAAGRRRSQRRRNRSQGDRNRGRNVRRRRDRKS